METVLTFLCVRSDGAIPAIDLRNFDDRRTACDHAGRLLLQHPSCDRVEAWQGDNLIFCRRRSDDDAARPTPRGV